jgi:hypothetical protein
LVRNDSRPHSRASGIPDEGDRVHHGGGEAEDGRHHQVAPGIPREVIEDPAATRRPGDLGQSLRHAVRIDGHEDDGRQHQDERADREGRPRQHTAERGDDRPQLHGAERLFHLLPADPRTGQGRAQHVQHVLPLVGVRRQHGRQPADGDD